MRGSSSATSPIGELVPFVAEISKGIRAQATLAGAELVECDANLDPKRVPDCMKELSGRRRRGDHPVPGDAGRPGRRLRHGPTGVPVLAVEFAQDPCAKTLVGADDLRAGQIAGRAVGEWVKERWSCTYDAYVSFESAVAATKSQKRMEGYRQGFSAVCPITNEQIGRAIDTEALAKTAMTDVLATLAGKTKIVVVADQRRRGARCPGRGPGRRPRG